MIGIAIFALFGSATQSSSFMPDPGMGYVVVTPFYNGDQSGTGTAAFPTTDSLVPVGPLTTARADHTATLLRGGSVVIAGGVAGYGSSMSAIDSFPPVTPHRLCRRSKRTTRRLNRSPQPAIW